MQGSFFIPAGRGQRISAMFYGPRGAGAGKTLAIMMHGFPEGHKSGRNDIFGELEFQILQDGLPSLRFDFRSCGESDAAPSGFSLSSAATDLRAARRWAENEGFENFVYVGEGLGGLVALMNTDEQVKAAVLLWPVLDPKAPALQNVPPGRAAPGFIEEFQSLDHAETLAEVRVPILVQQGDADVQAPYEQLDLLRRYGQNARRIEITCYEGGEHGLPKLNERQTLFFHVRQFIQKYA